jgi:Stress responsive A/B Barrel Domain
MRSDRPMGGDSNQARGGRSPPSGGRGCCGVGSAPGRVAAVLRHVVLFTWTDDADDTRRATSVEALRRLREDVGGMSELTVSADAGLVDGNAHAILVADFPDEESFRRYAENPVHQAVIAQHVRPWLAGRSAVQYVV